MKMEDYLKGDATAVRRCSTRALCPMGALCEKMTRENEPHPLFPQVVDITRGQLAWTDPYSEQRVYIIKSGVFLCVSGLEHEEELPFAIYGCGYSVGINELWIPRAVGKTYYMRAVSHATLCSLPAKPLRRQLETAPSDYALAAVSCALTNQTSASFAQAKMVSHALLSDRIAMVILRLRSLAAAENRTLDEIHLTHKDLAMMVCSDRASVTRALHKMREDGLIELGYRSIRPTCALESLETLRDGAQSQFHRPPDL